MFQVLDEVVLRLGVQKDVLVGGIGFGVGVEGFVSLSSPPSLWCFFRRLNVNPSAKAIPKMKRNMSARMILHFLVKILWGLEVVAGMGLRCGDVSSSVFISVCVFVVSGVLNIPPDDILTVREL